MIAVLINQVCFSACRDAALYLSAIPNVIVVGHDIHIKNAVGIFQDFATTITDNIRFQLGQIMQSPKSQKYIRIQPNIQAKVTQSGIRHAIQLHDNIDTLRKIVNHKIKL